MRPLRFAMVTTFYPPYSFGGDGIFVRRLAKSLAARGHHVEVIHDTDAYRQMSGKTPEKGPNDTELTVHALSSASPLLASLAVQQTGLPLSHRSRLNALLADRFDVINYHNVSLIGGPGTWACGEAIKLHTAHEHWLVCPSHILWRDNKEICDSRRCIRCQLRHGRPPQSWRATNLLDAKARHVDAFLMLSRSSMHNHRKFGFGHEMTMLPTFLPDAPDLPAAAPIHPRPFFFFAGRLEVIKGLQDVIPAFDDDVPADLLIAGDGDYLDTLRNLARGRDNVHFLGRLPEEDLRRYYRDAVATITPSRCYEVFPLVVLESFREGTPIIARNLGPYPEIVEDTGGGVLFDTPADLKAALIRLATEPALRDRLGAAGHAGFTARWQEDVAIEAYLKIVSDVAARKGVTLDMG